MDSAQRHSYWVYLRGTVDKRCSELYRKEIADNDAYQNRKNDYIFEFEVGAMKVDDKSYQVYDDTSSQLVIALGGLLVTLLIVPFI